MSASRKSSRVYSSLTASPLPPARRRPIHMNTAGQCMRRCRLHICRGFARCKMACAHPPRRAARRRRAVQRSRARCRRVRKSEQGDHAYSHEYLVPCFFLPVRVLSLIPLLLKSIDFYIDFTGSYVELFFIHGVWC